MSIRTNVDKLPWEIRQRINKDLEIKMINKYDMGPPRYIYPFEIQNDDIILPFSYAARTVKLRRPGRKDFPGMDLEFTLEPFPEQKELLKEAVGLLSGKGSVMISAFTGFGKCLKKNTPVLMYDGTIKAVQDIQVGEFLMGDDSTHREVLSLARGKEQMYDIVPTKGDKFGCNESHILSLKISGNKVIKLDRKRSTYYVEWIDAKQWKTHQRHFKTRAHAEEYKQNLEVSDIVDVEIGEYLRIPESIKQRLKLYRVPIEFPTKQVELDPYFLGLLLGDVNIHTSRITTASITTASITTASITTDDDAVRVYLEMFVKEIGMKLTCYDDCNENKCTLTDMVVSESGRVGDNTLLNKLRDYSLINNKHIPHIYKCNDRNTRLSLLAGLVDSTGYHNKNVYEIVPKNQRLANDIAYVARSLGFTSYIKQVNKTCTNNGKTGVYHLVTIYGEGLEQIPVLLQCKKASPRKPSQEDPLETSFNVVPIQDTNYYGFAIDGNHRFLLGDFTVTHNTFCATKLATQIGFRTLIIVNKIVLMKQWEEEIQKLCPDAVIQRLTTKSNPTNADFYIMNAQNIEKMGRKFFADIGTVIVDEAHLIMAESLSKSLQYVHPRYLIGLTATPYRVDGLDKLLDLYFGKYKIIRKLYREHTAYKVTTCFKPTIEKTSNGRVNWGVVLDSQANDEDRNELIIKLLRHFSERNFLVLTKRIAQGEYLIRRLEEEGEDVTSLLGKNQEFEQTSRILVGTSSKVGVGFNHPRLDALLLAADLEQYFIQYLGRVFRTKEVEPIIIDLVDNYSLLDKHFRTRRKVYQECGGTVRNFDIGELCQRRTLSTE